MQYLVGVPKTINATGAIIVGAGVLQAAMVTAAAANVTADVYDGIDANGTLLFSLNSAIAGSQTTPAVATPFQLGLWIVLSGSGVKFTAWL